MRFFIDLLIFGVLIIFRILLQNAYNLDKQTNQITLNKVLYRNKNLKYMVLPNFLGK